MASGEHPHPSEHRPGTATRPPPAQPPMRAMPTRTLVTEVARTASTLVRKEVELAKAEVRADIRSGVQMASGLGVAGVCALCVLNLLLAAGVLALMQAEVVPGWAAALIVAGAVAIIGAIAGLWGWARRVRKPLDTTRRSIQENVRWAKGQVA